MKKILAVMVGLVLAVGIVVAGDIAGDQNFKGRVNIDQGGILSLKGTTVSVTAAQLNAAGTSSTDNLNKIIPTFSGAAVANANGGTNVVTVTAKNMAGTTIADFSALFRCWIGDTYLGAPAAVAGDFAVGTGTEVQQILDKAHYLVATATNGVAVLTITDDPGRTNYLHIVSGGGAVSSVTLKFDNP